MTVLALTGSYWTKKDSNLSKSVIYSLDAVNDNKFQTAGGSLFNNNKVIVFSEDGIDSGIANKNFASFTEINPDSNTINFTVSYSGNKSHVLPYCTTWVSYSTTEIGVNRCTTSAAVTSEAFCGVFLQNDFSLKWGKKLTLSNGTQRITANSNKGGSCLDDNGNYIVSVNTCVPPNSAPFHHHICKLTQVNGNKIWERTLTGTGLGADSNMCTDAFGNIVVAHNIQDEKILIEKINSDGDLLYSKLYEPPILYFDELTLKVDSQFNVYVAFGGIDSATNNWRTCIMKIDYMGDVQWCKLYQVPQWWEIGSAGVYFDIDPSDNIFLVDNVYDDSEDYVNKLYLVKLNSSGVELEKYQIYNLDYNLYVYGVSVTSDRLLIDILSTGDATERTAVVMLLDLNEPVLGSFTNLTDTFNIIPMSGSITISDGNVITSTAPFSSTVTNFLTSSDYSIPQTSYPFNLSLYPFTPA